MTFPTTPPSPIKHWSAWLPLGLSFAALLLLLGYVALYGVARQTDEGAAAHVWQLLMAAQLPLTAYFAFKWLPKQPKPAAQVLALLAVTWLTNFGTLYWLEHLAQ